MNCQSHNLSQTKSHLTNIPIALFAMAIITCETRCLGKAANNARRDHIRSDDPKSATMSIMGFVERQSGLVIS